MGCGNRKTAVLSSFLPTRHCDRFDRFEAMSNCLRLQFNSQETMYCLVARGFERQSRDWCSQLFANWVVKESDKSWPPGEAFFMGVSWEVEMKRERLECCTILTHCIEGGVMISSEYQKAMTQGNHHYTILSYSPLWSYEQLPGEFRLAGSRLGIC